MATIDLQVNNPLIGGETPTSLTLNRGHEFKTVFDGFNYPYVLLESKTISPLNGVYLFEDLEIYQGSMNSDIFLYNGQIQNQRFPLTEELVDTSSVTVTQNQQVVHHLHGLNLQTLVQWTRIVKYGMFKKMNKDNLRYTLVMVSLVQNLWMEIRLQSHI